ncbi:benzil reductase ((S)-benzoin forming) [Cytobacillus horneckiae]|uniref:(S)-benzoin forming benzil reductase n=1 Tax=Cytobacillus horneckiae TaxID=549687 RepID=UPI0019D0294E|nr:(S)-benzoin forming benzil reductase [Cytobacillus horneckiae]MBN6889135.1 (S)-benzoin forming benzil reductase [Cytobacillus horneckiae]
MKLAIVTGASKGLGASIAEQLLDAGLGVFTLSRTKNKRLEEKSRQSTKIYKHFTCNLASVNDIEQTMLQMIVSGHDLNISTIYLFNNAAVIKPIANAGSINHSDLIHHTQVNFNAPVMITNMLLKQAKVPCQIINISSSAGERPLQGWSIYNSMKAAINMFTKTVALEQKSAGTDHKIISFNPGIMDTPMQETIRSSTREAFHDLERFKSYKEKGLLQSPDKVASALLNLCLHEEMISGHIYDISDL